MSKILGIGNRNDKGAWDHGSPLFIEHEPRFSIDDPAACSLAIGPVKEWYAAFDWIYDHGSTMAASNEYAWGGHRAQLKYIVPIRQLNDGASLTYIGFTNCDFGKDLRKENPAHTANMLGLLRRRRLPILIKEF